jgi:hypothetical protein
VLSMREGLKISLTLREVSILLMVVRVLDLQWRVVARSQSSSFDQQARP